LIDQRGLGHRFGQKGQGGRRKPDIGTVKAFKRALTAARSIAYLREGQSGLAMMKAQGMESG
jgi:hypothetical protein